MKDTGGFFGSEYLESEGHLISDKQTKKEVDFLSGFINNPKSGILELCCGHGRVANELFKRGFLHYTGVDSSSEAISYAKSNITGQSFILSDIVNDDLGKKYNLIFALYNSMAYWGQDTTAGILKKVERSLDNNGYFVFDVIPHRSIVNLIGIYKIPLIKTLIRVLGYRNAFLGKVWATDVWDSDGEIAYINRTYLRGASVLARATQEIYIRTNEQWSALIYHAGLSIEAKTVLNTRLVYVCRKPGHRLKTVAK